MTKAPRKKSEKPERLSKGPVPIGKVLSKVTERTMSGRGFVHAALVTDWRTIVGEELGMVSQPDRLTFPRGQRDQATLHIRVLGAVATEMQHLAPLVIERVNRFFGFRAVTGLRLHQTDRIDLPQRKKQRREPAAAPDPARLEEMRPLLARVADEELREVLTRLGGHLARRGGR